MPKLPAKILTISWDPTLAMDSPDFGDAQKRNVKYGEGVDGIYSITYSRKKADLKNKQLSDNVFIFPTNSIHPLIFLFDAWKIAKKICQENEIKLVLTQDPFLTGLVGLWVKRKFGCKLLIHYHGDFWYNKNWRKERWYNFIFNFLQRVVLKKADVLRVMSEGQREKFIKTGWSPNRVRVISTPVDLNEFLNYQSIFSSQDDQKIVLHIGRDDEVKDYDTLIKAFKLVKEKINDAVFWQVGADKKIKTAMELNNFSDVNVKGKKSIDEIIGFYYRSQVFVLSSTSESFGKVLVEANACAKPVVSTVTTGAKEIIEDGQNGFLVPIGDYQKMAEKIIWLLANPDSAKKMGEYGRKLMQEKYNDNTDKIIQFWQDIITNNL